MTIQTVSWEGGKVPLPVRAWKFKLINLNLFKANQLTVEKHMCIQTN